MPNNIMYYDMHLDGFDGNISKDYLYFVLIDLNNFLHFNTILIGNDNEL